MLGWSRAEITGGTRRVKIGPRGCAGSSETGYECAMDEQCRDLGGCSCGSLRCNNNKREAAPSRVCRWACRHVFLGGLSRSGYPAVDLQETLQPLPRALSEDHTITPSPTPHQRYPPQGRGRQLPSVPHPLPLLLASEQCRVYTGARPAS